jgi:hypothetical protein
MARYEDNLSPKKGGVTPHNDNLVSNFTSKAMAAGLSSLKIQEKGMSDTISMKSTSKNHRFMLFQKTKKNNNIKPLKNPKQIRFTNLDFECPLMIQALTNLGLTKEDLNISKRLDDFSFDFNKQGEKLPIDDKIADLRFKHY